METLGPRTVPIDGLRGSAYKHGLSSSSRKLMTQEARSAAPSRKKTPVAAGKQDGRGRANNDAAVQHYQAAVQLLQQGKYEKALGLLEKLLPEAPPEIQDRCRMYIVTCRRQMEKNSLSFQTPEEYYDYAISKLNTGYYEE